MKAQVLSLFWDKEKSINIVGLTLTAICLALGLSSAALAGSSGGKDKDKKGAVEECEVKNFGKTNDYIYRGGQPEEEEYEQLAALGIKTVIDLREDARSGSRALAKKAGMSYINIRLDDKRPPTMEESNLFLSFVKDRTNGPVFVHCAGGRHRTGVLIAVYRMEVDGWNARQAYEEMKDYKFYSRFGHDEMKDYVFDYYRGLVARRSQSEVAKRARRVTDQSR